MNEILIPISPGELLDKITILQIKAERISDPAKVVNVRSELDMLQKVWGESVSEDLKGCHTVGVKRNLHVEAARIIA